MANPLKQTAPAESKQRRYKRRKVRLAVSIETDDGKFILGEATDISAGGMRLSSTGELEVGDKGTAQISLGGGETVRADIEIAWEEKASAATTLYGVHFKQLSEEDRYSLFEAIYSHGAGKGGAFLGVAEKPTDEIEEEAPTIVEQLDARHHAYYMNLIRRIGDVHKLSADDIDRLLFARLHAGRPLREALVECKLATPVTVDEFLSSIYGVPYVDLSRVRTDHSVSESVPVAIATSQNILPIRRHENKLIVAMADPLDLPTLDMLALRSKDEVEVWFAMLEDVERAINDVYHGATLRSVGRLLNAMPDRVGATLVGPDGEADVQDLEALRKLSDTTPIISLVDSMLRTAVEEHASDIHLEPGIDKVACRMRLDGVLHEMQTLPKNVYAAVVSRIKIMARMDITIRHVPQDGRTTMRYHRKEYDLRLNSLPTVNGEKIVIRLLEKNPAFKQLAAVGFAQKNYEAFAPLVHRPHGMILCCGPTGSGKSTTLFACLQEINDGQTNITTIEDPVEYRVAGVNQVEVNNKRGLTFSSVLRALLRQDPDVIYVGEIRDRETADLAVRAALTGHLLLSTLHTNTAVQAITRLVDIGIDPALIGSSLIGIIGQRLVRRICGKCKEEYTLPAEEAIVLQEMLPLIAPSTLWRGSGCNQCRDTGYYGRFGVHEVVVIDEGLRRLIAKGADSNQLLDYAVSRGFSDMREDALAHLLAGDTTLQEVMRVTVAV